MAEVCVQQLLYEKKHGLMGGVLHPVQIFFCGKHCTPNRPLDRYCYYIESKNLLYSLPPTLGWTSSLESLLKSTSQAKLSEHDPLRISQTEDTDAKPVTDQKTAYNDSTTPDSTHSRGQQSKGDPTHISDSTHHSRSIDKRTFTVPCDSGPSNRNSKENEDHADFSNYESETSQTLSNPMTSTSVESDMSVDTSIPSPDDDTASQPVTYKHQIITQTVNDSIKMGSLADSKTQPLTVSDSLDQQCTSLKYESVQTTSEGILTVTNTTSSSASVDTSLEPAYKAIIHCHDKLVTALSTDILTISNILFAKEFIPDETFKKMLLPTLSQQEKATILAISITEKIKLVPSRFQELIKLFSEQTCTKDIITSLSSHVSCEHVPEDKGQNKAEVIATSQQYAVCEGHMYTAWGTLDPDDKIDLEARLLTDAETIGEKFAHLCSMARDSFERRGITPQMLTDTLLDLTVYKPGRSCHDIIPLLKEEGGALVSAQSVRETFHALRPHMSFFNYEILKFLIEREGSENDKTALATFLRDFIDFCKRHVFEVPFTTYSNGHHFDGHKTKQRLHIKVTEHFKAAFLIKSSCEAVPSTSDNSQANNIYSSKLGMNLEDAKNIQRKLSDILNLNPSSLYLDSISEGNVILTFLLPMCVSLAGLDCNPEIALLSSNGVIFLCGPPGKPELKELTSNGIVVRWSAPEYGCDSLAQYILYYQKQYEVSEWQIIKLNSLETHTCVPDLNDGDRYVFKICTVSDVGTLQYSDESDPVVLYNSVLSDQDICTVITTCHEMTTLALSLANPKKIATTLVAKKVISEENEAGITLNSKPSEQAMILSTIIHKTMKTKPEKFQEFLDVLSKESLIDNIVETLWSVFYHDVCIQYSGYLKFLYASLHNKQTSSNQWPPSATHKFFRLAMIKTATVKREHIDDKFVRMTITGKVDDILHQKYPIKLENIFQETPRGRRKVILLEGAPGCGKSTLSVYICQQWEKGQLFNQFQLVILVRLRDPAVRNAECLADLLPCPDTKTAQLLAGIMMEMKCQDVLFILDGWDELPLNLRKLSLFDDLINSDLPWSNPLSKSTAIVTSRPISSGDLYPHASSRVEILGFTPEELHQFFTECLKGDAEAVKTLLERIEENPEVAGSCYLPLNATILVYLFKSDRNTLPTTLYGIFSSLVFNCMQRHLKLRTQYKDVSIESLDQLPEVAKKPFSVLCQFAYDGVMEGKIIFTSLPADVNTLSLLQGVESFIGREKTVSHNFIHLSIQELLAAWYIATQLPASEQVSKFNELFHTSRFSAIFQYYSAITKLKTHGIKNVVIRVVNESNETLMLSLLHCLYEAQDPSLCESVAQQLQHGLDLSDTTLTPSDCLCIGYFLVHVCNMAAGEFKVYLSSCSIGDQDCKYLVSGLHKYLDTHSAVTTLLNIDMSFNAISHRGLHHLSTLLKIGCIDHLDLSGNNLLSEQDTIHATIDTFTEQLKYNTTLKTLWLQKCGLRSLSAESLAEALTTNKHLEQLFITNNALCDDGIQHLAHALTVNQGLKSLLLVSCDMTDVGLECLAKSLQHNNVLTQLQVWNLSIADSPNRITEKIVPVLTECLQNNHTLTKLALPKNLKSSTTSIEEAVNDVRKRSGLPLIEVTGMYVPLNEDSM